MAIPFQPTLKDITLKPYRFDFTFDPLCVGVDNIRHDVRVSGDFQKAADNLILQLIVRYARIEDLLEIDTCRDEFQREKAHFKGHCREVLLHGLHTAKSKRQVHIDYLAQMAVTKIITKALWKCFDKMAYQLKHRIRALEVSHSPEKAVALKDRYSRISQNKEAFLGRVGGRMFAYVSEVNRSLDPLRETNFGADHLLPDDYLANPMLLVKDSFSDFFMLEEYGILLGRRIEDADRYQGLIWTLRGLLGRICRMDEKREGIVWAPEDPKLQRQIDNWIKNEENIDLLFDVYTTLERYRQKKKQKVPTSELAQLRRMARGQRRRLEFFYHCLNRQTLPPASADEEGENGFLEFLPGMKEKRSGRSLPLFRRCRITIKDWFAGSGLFKLIAAADAILPFYRRYCPPLSPQVVRQFLINRAARKEVKSRLNRLRRFYNRSFSLRPLKKAARSIRWSRPETRKKRLVTFLKNFVRFHRDYQSSKMIRQCLSEIHLLSDEKMIALSRTNNTLYEFLLPHERSAAEHPIVGHVVIKADVRGSTDITHRMMEKGLNPASHFSLNFFDPISEILDDYDAEKIFVEGDALILSIFERENNPDEGYSVARACGAAIRILSVVQHYNERNRKHDLPVIELGIGICYRNAAPAFLMDGTHRIMISSAINLADRLSGCSKKLRNRTDIPKGLFRLFVYQSVSDADMGETADDLLLRYNVNGIELHPGAFEKLSEEIDLKEVRIPLQNGEKHNPRFFTGRFPSSAGFYQPLIICEARIPKISEENMKSNWLTQRKYYEVCADPSLYACIKKIAKERNAG